VNANTATRRVALLDPDAVEKAVRMWSDAESRRHLGPTPEALTQALQHTQLHHADPSVMPKLYSAVIQRWSAAI